MRGGSLTGMNPRRNDDCRLIDLKRTLVLLKQTLYSLLPFRFTISFVRDSNDMYLAMFAGPT